QHEREMAGTAQADRAAIVASGRPSRFGEFCRHCAVRGYPRYGIVAWGGDVSPIDVRNASEIERDIAAFARNANGGLIVTGSAAEIHHDLIIALAARYKLPAVYNSHLEAADGGLSPTGPISSTSSAARPAMSIESSTARNRPICRCR